jgi:hypothetical protein
MNRDSLERLFNRAAAIVAALACGLVELVALTWSRRPARRDL